MGWRPRTTRPALLVGWDWATDGGSGKARPGSTESRWPSQGLGVGRAGGRRWITDSKCGRTQHLPSPTLKMQAQHWGLRVLAGTEVGLGAHQGPGSHPPGWPLSCEGLTPQSDTGLASREQTAPIQRVPWPQPPMTPLQLWVGITGSPRHQAGPASLTRVPQAFVLSPLLERR